LKCISTALGVAKLSNTAYLPGARTTAPDESDDTAA
jgi:hypothetical protein